MDLTTLSDSALLSRLNCYADFMNDDEIAECERRGLTLKRRPDNGNLFIFA